MTEPPDDPIEALVFECLERFAGEGEAVVADLCARHPGLADELRARITRLRRSGLMTERDFPERLGDFALLRRLGGGGMGVVFLARQARPERLVALKVVRPEQLYFAGRRERFAREADAVARLDHPGIVPLHQVGEHDGVPFLVMPWIEGVTLAEVLADLRGRRPEELTGSDLARVLVDRLGPSGAAAAHAPLYDGGWVAVCLRIARDVAAALTHAHQRGVIHRDVKPSNLMLTADGRVLLFDFGLARAQGTERMTLSGATLGSLAYLAPEHARGSDLEPGPATDVYSLGVTLYEALTLELPYLGTSSEDTRRRILTGQPRAVRLHNPAVSVDAETVCRKAMAAEAAQRYGSAAALAQDLQSVLALRPIAARRPGLVERLWRTARRHPAGATIAVLLFLLLVVVPTAFGLWQQAAKERADRAAYRGNLAGAQAHLAAHELADARRLLAECAEPLRGWEWRLVAARVDTSLDVFHHAQAIDVAAVSGDGARVALGDALGGLSVVELGPPARVTRLRTSREDPNEAGDGPEARLRRTLTKVLGVAFHPDGKRLVAGLANGRVLEWDLATGQILPRRREHPGEGLLAGAYAVAFDAGGTRLLSGSVGGDLRLWDANTDRQLSRARLPDVRLFCLALHPDGRRFATGSQDGMVRVFDADSGKLLDTLAGHAQPVQRIQFRPDGKGLASSSADGSVRVWDLEQRTAVALPGHEEKVDCVVWSPDGRQLLTAGQDTFLRVWDVAARRAVLVHQGHAGPVFGLGLADQARRLVSASWDGTVRTWDLTRPQFVVADRLRLGSVLALAQDARGTRLLAGTQSGEVVLYDSATLGELRRVTTHDARCAAVAMAPDGSRLWCADDQTGVLVCLDAASGQERWRAEPNRVGVHALAVAPDGGELAVGRGDGKVELLDPATGQRRQLLAGHERPVAAVLWAPDGRALVSASHDATVRVWSRSGQLQHVLRGHTAAVHALAIQPGGALLASAGSDLTLRTWDLATGAPRLVLPAGDQSLRALAFLADGSRLLSSGADRTVRIWEPVRGEPLAALRVGSWTSALLAHPDGARVLFGSQGGTLGVFDSLPARERALR